jgi:DNA primase large subunit
MDSITEPPSDNSLQDEVERLRILAPDTKALYREVASMLFFRFGIAPTANRLHQLVGKGSMTTAASVLARFWQDLRQHGRVRLEHPAVPEQLRDLGGHLIGQLWRSAFDQAHEDLAKARAELQDEGERVRRELAQTRLATSEAEARAEELTEIVQGLQTEIAKRDAFVADLERDNAQLRAEVAALRSSLAERREEVEESRQRLARDLEGLRAAIALTEERARGNERRALSEVEVARRAAANAVRTMGLERKRFEAENVRDKKLLVKRGAEVEALRSRLARSEASLSQVSAQLKGEQAKLSALLRKMRPAPSKRASHSKSRSASKRIAVQDRP